MDRAELVPVSAEWALHGQEPGERGDRILRCSEGVFSHEDFAAIVTRYHSGTPEQLPQVTMGWAGSGERVHLIMAVQERSHAQDWLGRPLLGTRLLCVPYDQLRQRAVGYETLYTAFTEQALPARGPVRLYVEPLRPWKFAAQVTDHAMATAALLLSGSRVCVVDGDDVPVGERLRYLDTVTALLPYGMRPYLSASTWTSSTAEHHIRLSFTKHGRDGAHSVSWRRTPEPAYLTEDVHSYLDLLREATDPARVIEFLAGAGAPLPFREIPAALEILRSAAQTPEPAMPGGHATPGEVEALLESAADALDRNWHDELGKCLRLLDPAARTDHGHAARERYRHIVARREMLPSRSSLPGELALRLYRIVLHLVYGPTLAVADVRATLDEVPRPSGQLIDALRRMPPESPAATLLLERRLGTRGRDRALAATTLADLVGSVLREPPDRELVELLCTELTARGSLRGDADVAEALHEHGYLAEVIEDLYPNEREAQVRQLNGLLTAAYGPVLGPAARDHVISAPGAYEHLALVTAVNLLSAAPSPHVSAVPPRRDETPPRLSSPTAPGLMAVMFVVLLAAAITLFVLIG